MRLNLNFKNQNSNINLLRLCYCCKSPKLFWHTAYFLQLKKMPLSFCQENNANTNFWAGQESFSSLQHSMLSTALVITLHQVFLYFLYLWIFMVLFRLYRKTFNILESWIQTLDHIILLDFLKSPVDNLVLRNHIGVTVEPHTALKLDNWLAN